MSDLSPWRLHEETNDELWWWGGKECTILNHKTCGGNKTTTITTPDVFVVFGPLLRFFTSLQDHPWCLYALLPFFLSRGSCFKRFFSYFILTPLYIHYIIWLCTLLLPSKPFPFRFSLSSLLQALCINVCCNTASFIPYFLSKKYLIYSISNSKL